MYTSSEKISNHVNTVQRNRTDTAFFRKANDEVCLDAKDNTTFFKPYIQTKLSVSHPDDPQEKEADEVADKVMRMSEPAILASASGKEEDRLHRKEDEEEINPKSESTPVQYIHCKEDDDELHRKEEEEIQSKAESPEVNYIQCKQEEEDKLHAKLFNSVQRMEDRSTRNIIYCKDNEPSENSETDRKHISKYKSDTIQCSGRGPPPGGTSFEQTLSSSKGSGSPMSASSLGFMESRFNADFSNVRIHTDSSAENLSRSINAQAFTNGSDIYFNTGKYSPDTSSGSFLLAHELTHTIQQGAAKHTNISASRKISPKNNSGKKNSDKFTNINPKCCCNDHAESNEPDDSSVSEIQTPAQTKPEIGKSSVNSSGKICLKENISEEKDEFQKKELLEQSETPVLQADYFQGYSGKEQESENNASCVCSADSIQRKTESLASLNPPLNSSDINHCQENISDTHNRGPPLNESESYIEIQRSPVDDALAFAGSITDCITIYLDEAKKCALQKAQQVALHIPGYRALRVVLGKDPITDEHIDRSGRNFLEAAFDIIPGGSLLFQKLDELHQIDAAATWIDTKIGVLQALVIGLFSEFRNFWNSLGIEDLTSPLDVIKDGGNIVLRFLSNILNFAIETGTELLRMVKDFLLSKIVEFIKEKTTAYPLLIVILGEDPITKQQVVRNGTNILNALLELGGEEGIEQRKQMQETGTFQKVAGYIDKGIAVFKGAYEQILTGFNNIWNVVSIESLMDPVGTFQMIYNEFAPPVKKVLDFVKEVGSVILKFIKEVLMQRLAAWAKTVRGYSLLTLIIGKDPFTDEIIPMTIENVIRGFMSLMEGGEEQFNQLKESGAIEKTALRINAAVAKLNMTAASIIQLFIGLWNSFSINDLIHPIVAFERIIAKFGQPIGRLIAFVVEIVRIVIEVILQVMNFPFDLINNIISRAMAAFERIKNDPVGFLKNILRAIKQGFIQFFGNIITHLINGVLGWLMSELKDANVPQPKDFTLKGIIGWVLEVLGISMDAIWEKLSKHPKVGPERVAKIKKVINTLEGIWTFIKDVQERGVAAIWDKIQEQLSNLWNVVLDAVKNWIMEKIITQVTTKLLSFLDPTGIMAVINSAIAIYKAVQSFIKYLRQMLEVINSFVSGVADIAEGNILTAANYLEGTMDKAMPIVIGFLANQVGLGGVGKKVGEMIGKAREMVDKALTWLVNKAVDTGMAMLDKVVSTGKAVVGAVLDWWKKKSPVKTKDGKSHTLYLEKTGEDYKLMIQSTPETYKQFIEATLKANGITVVPGSVEEAAIKKATAIDDKLAGYGKVKQEDRVTWGENVAKQIDDLADLTSNLSINMDVPDPPSIVRWGSPNSDGFGTIMIAEILSENYIKGEPAKSDSKAVLGWDYARSFQKISAKGNPTPIYIKGHLLNDKLGGPANVLNLTTITDDMNKIHVYEVERNVKKLVTGKSFKDDKSPTPKMVAAYSVNVEYNKHPQRRELITYFSDIMWQVRRDLSIERKKPSPDGTKVSEYKAKDESAMNVLALLSYEENSLATGFDCQWSQLQFNKTTNKWEPVPGTSQRKHIPHTLPSEVMHFKPIYETYKTDIK